MVTSASTATIVRFPYINGLTNLADFLYATTDVAIWSTAETGIGITAACIATLRPLLRTFFSHKNLLSSTRGETGGWTNDGRSRAGYMRSKDPSGGGEELGLRSDIGKCAGVTTIIESQRDETERSGRGGKNSESQLQTPGRWDSESKLTDRSSEEYNTASPDPWGHGIRKTMVVNVDSKRT